MVLLLLALLMAFGMAFLTQKSVLYEGAVADTHAVAAHSLARFGLEQVRVKLNKDLEFPPQSAVDQHFFTYTEKITDLDGTTEVGTVRVALDLRYLNPPYEVLPVRCVGLLGTADDPKARREITAEFDLAEFERGTTNPNPDRFKMIRYLDHGRF